MPEELSPYNLTGISTSDKEPLTISAGDITPAKRFVIVAAQTGVTDFLDGIITSGIWAPGDADGAVIYLMADAGDTITIRNNQNAAATKNVLTQTGASVTMAGNTVIRAIYNINLDTNGAWVVSSGSVDAHVESHDLASHSAKAHGDLSDAPATAHHDNANDHSNASDHSNADDHTQNHNVLSADHPDSVAASVVRGDLLVANSTPKLARLAAGARKASTTPSSIQTQWANLTGTARQVLVKDSSGDVVWAYVNAIDIQNPPKINSFSDGLIGTYEIDNAGTRSPSFLLTYEGTPSACQIAMDAQMETDLEVSASDYPQDLTGDFGATAEAGAAIKNAITQAMINRTYTWTATATVDGTSGLTKTTTLKWLNRVYIGPHTDTQIDTAGILEVDATGDGESVLRHTIAGTYTAIRVSGSEYLWVCHRVGSDISSIIDNSTGFSIGGEYKTNVSHTNDSGFTETFRVWRSTNQGILDHAPNVTITV